MALLIPDSHIDLIEKPVYVVLTTVMRSGQPQSSVVWWDSEGDYVRINTAIGRQKEKNLRENPRVTILAMDPTNPYKWLEVRGLVEDITTEGAYDHIESLSWKYTGQQYYGGYNKRTTRETETRIIVRIRPTKVLAYPPKR